MNKTLHRIKACIFGFEYLSRGLEYPEDEKVPQMESYAEILNKIGADDEGEDKFSVFIPAIFIAFTFIILRAGYFLFIYQYQLP